MTKKNTFAKHLGEFLLGLVKVCVFMAAMAGTVVASAFFFVQGTFVVLNKYGFRGITIELGIMIMALMFACFVFEEKRDQNNAQRTRSKAATEKLEPRWRRNAPTTLTKVPLSKWTLASLTVLRQIELALDSHRFYASDTHVAILCKLRPDQYDPNVFVSATNSSALREFIHNGGRARRVNMVNGGGGKPIISTPGYSVWLRFASANDELAGLARSIRSEAQAEIDRRDLKNKETNRD